MTKTIKVSRCIDCPFLSDDDFESRCQHEDGPDGQTIGDIFSIPDCCPLRENGVLIEIGEPDNEKPIDQRLPRIWEDWRYQ